MVAPLQVAKQGKHCRGGGEYIAGKSGTLTSLWHKVSRIRLYVCRTTSRLVVYRSACLPTAGGSIQYIYIL